MIYTGRGKNVANLQLWHCCSC